MTQSVYYKEYNVDISSLEDWELELLDLMKKIVELCGSIYSKQKNVEFPGGNFYDHDLSREAIQKAASKDPQILSNTTVVRKNKSGEIVAIPYHIEYADEISQMKNLVDKAAKLHRDAKYKEYLEQFSKDLESSDYSQSEKLWLQLNGQKVDLRLGPIETYNDKLFGIKRAFQANLRVINEREQQHVKDYVNVIVELQPSSPFSVENPEKNLKVRVDNIVAIGGWHADLIPRGSNYPDDIELSDFGVKVLIYDNTTRVVNERFYDLAKEILEPEEFENINKENFLSNSSRYILFHEIAEAIVKLRYPDFEDRLLAMNDIVREIFSDLIGIKSASIQVLKGVLYTDDYRDLLLIFVLEAIWQWYKAAKQGRAVGTYATGFVMATDFLIKNGGIDIKPNGKISINYATFFTKMDELTNICLALMKEGIEDEANKLFDQYSDSSFLEEYSKYIKE